MASLLYQPIGLDPASAAPKAPEELKLPDVHKDEPVFPPHVEQFHVAPTAMSVNSADTRVLIGGSHMLKLFEISNDMRLVALDKDVPDKFRSLSRSTIKDIAWNPCIVSARSAKL